MIPSPLSFTSLLIIDGCRELTGYSTQGGRVPGIIESDAFHVSETEGVVNWSGQRFDLRKVRRVWASKNPGVPLHLAGALTTAPWPNTPRFIPTSVGRTGLKAPASLPPGVNRIPFRKTSGRYSRKCQRLFQWRMG
jgi:hypothetical protein